MKATLETVVAIVITGVWVLVIMVDILNPQYDIPGTVQTAMTAVIAYIFGKQYLQLKGKKNGNGENDKLGSDHGGDVNDRDGGNKPRPWLGSGTTGSHHEHHRPNYGDVASRSQPRNAHGHSPGVREDEG